jgi:uncharacterized protein (TIGR03083 family)
MDSTAIPVGQIHTLTQPEAGRVAATENERALEQMRSLSEDEWAKPTDCPAWDVRALAGHVVGMTDTFTSYRHLMRQMRAGGKRAKAAGVPVVDGLTALQVEQHAALSVDELLAKYADVGPVAARFRAGANRLFRKMPMTEEVGGKKERWRMAYLLDTILTRDTWMHRVDIATATGRPLDLTPEHDGRIVADVVAEWARRHGQPFTLVLDGPAGGAYTNGEGGESIQVDAIEFCRILSGRAEGTGLLDQEVPF